MLPPIDPVRSSQISHCRIHVFTQYLRKYLYIMIIGRRLWITGLALFFFLFLPEIWLYFFLIYQFYAESTGYSRGVSAARAECRVLVEWCADCNCRRRDATVSMMVIAVHKWGSNVTGGTCMPWEPEGGPYLSTYLCRRGPY